jgi:phytoene synthase
VSGDEASAALRAADEDFWLAAQFAPTDLRAKLTALFLLRAEIARVPAAVKEPALGEMRLQWWRDAIAAIPGGAAPRGQPALAAAERSGLFKTLDVEALGPAIEARSRLLYDPYFATPDALAAWLRAAEGGLCVAALRLASSAPGADAMRSAEAAGAAFALARERRGFLVQPDASIETAYAALIGEARAGLGAIEEGARGTLLICAMASLYRDSVRPSGLAKRWRLFRATLSGDPFGR